MKRFKNGFNLLELLIVIIVIGVLTTFVIPSYFGVNRRAKEKEASAILRLIQAAEKTIRLETGNFVSCNNISDCNSKLRLDISAAGSFDYKVTLIGSSDFCAQATGSNNYKINSTGDVVEGNCS